MPRQAPPGRESGTESGSWDDRGTGLPGINIGTWRCGPMTGATQWWGGNLPRSLEPVPGPPLTSFHPTRSGVEMSNTPGRQRPTFTDQEALLFHSNGRPGKLEVIATKPMATQRDLSLA